MTLVVKKIAFVIPWFGHNIAGGAEAECYGLVSTLIAKYPHIQVEVLTTALKEFSHDWNHNFHSPGCHNENGILVRRFLVSSVDRSGFAITNRYRLMAQTVEDLLPRPGVIKSPLTPTEEKTYLENMVHSETLNEFLRMNQKDYDFFIFMPYMFATTVQGIAQVKAKALIIPCLHDERYAYMQIYREMMASVQAALFHVPAEEQLAAKLYQFKKSYLLGEMVRTLPESGDSNRFRQKYNIDGPFILYAGRKVEGKGLPALVDMFRRARQDDSQWAEIKLVILGKGELDYRNQDSDGIIDLGFVDEQDKLDAMAATDVFCMPSLYESFSIVIMEAWLQKRPILVNGKCQVTKDHVTNCDGGTWYDDDISFQQGIKSLVFQKQHASALGEKGYAYVLENYVPDVVIDRFVGILEDLLTPKRSGGRSRLSSRPTSGNVEAQRSPI